MERLSEHTCGSTAFLRVLGATAERVIKIGRKKMWTRKKVDLILWGAFQTGESWHPDAFVEEACAEDSTLYNMDDVLNALYGTWRVIYESGDAWTLPTVRRYVQRALCLPRQKMNPDGTRKRDVEIIPPETGDANARALHPVSRSRAENESPLPLVACRAVTTELNPVLLYVKP